MSYSAVLKKPQSLGELLSYPCADQWSALKDETVPRVGFQFLILINEKLKFAMKLPCHTHHLFGFSCLDDSAEGYAQRMLAHMKSVLFNIPSMYSVIDDIVLTRTFRPGRDMSKSASGGSSESGGGGGGHASKHSIYNASGGGGRKPPRFLRYPPNPLSSKINTRRRRRTTRRKRRN